MIINQEIEIKIPNELTLMSEEKRNAMQFIAEGEGCCLENEESHLLISIGWKKIGIFAHMMLNTNDLYKGLEKSIQSGMQAFHYQKEMDVEKNIGTSKMKGIRYTYISSTTDMVGESYVIKRGKNVYYFHYYSRKDFDKENTKTWEKIIASARWI